MSDFLPQIHDAPLDALIDQIKREVKAKPKGRRAAYIVARRKYFKVAGAPVHPAKVVPMGEVIRPLESQHRQKDGTSVKALLTVRLARIIIAKADKCGLSESTVFRLGHVFEETYHLPKGSLRARLDAAVRRPSPKPRTASTTKAAKSLPSLGQEVAQLPQSAEFAMARIAVDAEDVLRPTRQRRAPWRAMSPILG